MKDNETPLGQGILLISQTIAEEQELQSDMLLQELERQWSEYLGSDELLAAGIEKRRQGLLQFFYQDMGFCADKDNYFLPAGSSITKALSSRSGGPMILGLLLLHLAKIAKIQLDGLNFPSHFIVSYTNATNKTVYFDPYTQEKLNLAQLQSRLRGMVSQFTQLDPKVHLKVLNNNELIQRYISVNKASYIRSHQYLYALRCNELLLEIDPGDPYEIRDRGFLFEQLDCHQLAVEDYAYFTRHCPDDPAVPLLESQMEVLKETNNVLH